MSSTASRPLAPSTGESEDRRVARADGEPSKHRAAGAAGGRLPGLGPRRHRERRAAPERGGAPDHAPGVRLDPDRAAPATCSTWSSAGSCGGSSAGDVPEPWGDWTVDEPWNAGGDVEPGGRWAVADGVTGEEPVARLWAVAERTRGVLRDFPLDATASPGGRFRRTRRRWSGSASARAGRVRPARGPPRHRRGAGRRLNPAAVPVAGPGTQGPPRLPGEPGAEQACRTTAGAPRCARDPHAPRCGVRPCAAVPSGPPPEPRRCRLVPHRQHDSRAPTPTPGPRHIIHKSARKR